MIVPVRCFTCNKVLADKWLAYQRRCQELKEPSDGRETAGQGEDAPEFLDPAKPEAVQKTARGRILDDLGLTRLCCRRVMLTHVDLASLI